MADERKQLFLVRHAKSSWKDASLADIERPLNARGERNAPLMGEWLGCRDSQPQFILSSPATRALATAGLLAASLGIDPADIEVDEGLYFAGTDGMLRALERVDDTWDRVMMVGHNPVMTRLLNQLTGCDLWNMPTCAIAVVDFDMPSWGLVASTEGVLADYQTPRRLDEVA